MANISKKPDFIFLPSAVKESKAYSQTPNDGTGDFTFYRNSTTTRINERGQVESWPKNLLLYSQDFSNASWNKSGITVTHNDTLAPDGTMTADKVVFSGSNQSINQQIISFNLGVCAHTIYVKGTAGETIYIEDGYIAIPNVTLTGDWQKITWMSDRGSGQYQGLAVGTYNSVTARTVWLWGAQLERSFSPTPYMPTTTRLNLPTIDYSDGGPTLLLNPQATNLVTYSQDFTNAGWTKNGSTVNANVITAPDGTLTGTQLNVTAVTYSGLYVATTSTSAIYTVSFFVKKGTKKWFYITNPSANAAKVWFDLDLGILGTVSSGYTATISLVSNGWYRCTITNLVAEPIVYTQCGVSDANNSSTPSSAGYIYIWGAQTEVGLNASSYIPTIASTVTRVLEGGITNFIPKSNRVTVYAEFKLESTGQNVALYGFRPAGAGYTVSNIYYLFFWGTDSNKFGFNTANGDLYGISNSTIADGKYHKVIAVFDYTNFANNELYIDGVKQTISQVKGTTTQITTKNNFSTLYAQGTTSADEDPRIAYREMAIWDTELTDAECIDLTFQTSLSNALVNKHRQLVLGSGGVVEAENLLNNNLTNLK
jgi:hypothetical protein